MRELFLGSLYLAMTWRGWIELEISNAGGVTSASNFHQIPFEYASKNVNNFGILQQSLLRNTTGNLGLNNILEYTPAKSKYSLIQKTFNHLSQVYELKWFEYPQVAGTVEKDERLIQAIEKTALEQFADSDNNDEEYYMKLVKNNEKRAKKLLYDMRSTLSDFLLR